MFAGWVLALTKHRSPKLEDDYAYHCELVSQLLVVDKMTGDTN
jgi:hypothetical protein